MNILEFIPYGRENAIKRRNLRELLGVTDRDMRRLLAEARKEAVILNLQDGQGYYRPTNREELYSYILQEKARAEKIIKNVNVAVKEYNSIEGQTTLIGEHYVK